MGMETTTNSSIGTSELLLYTTSNKHDYFETRKILRTCWLIGSTRFNSSLYELLNSSGKSKAFDHGKLKRNLLQTNTVWQWRIIPEFFGVNFAALFFVEDAKHVTHFSLLFVVADLFANDSAKLVEADVAGTYITPSLVYRNSRHLWSLHSDIKIREFKPLVSTNKKA